MEWWKNKILPGVVTAIVFGAFYTYADVKTLKTDMVEVKTSLTYVKDVKNLICLLALKTKDDKLKEKICAGSSGY